MAAGLGGSKQPRVVGAGEAPVEPRALEVDPGQLAVVDQVGEHADLGEPSSGWRR